MEIWLLLRAVAEYFQLMRAEAQFIEEIVDDAVRRPRADDIRETKDMGEREKTLHRGADHAFTSQLHRAVVRNREERSGFFRQNIRIIAVDSRRGCECDSRNLKAPHRRERVIGG